MARDTNTGVGAADDLALHWLRVGDAQATNAANAAQPNVTSHQLSNAVTAISGAAQLLHDRWDDLDENNRRELAAIVLRRSDELRHALERSVFPPDSDH